MYDNTQLYNRYKRGLLRIYIVSVRRFVCFIGCWLIIEKRVIVTLNDLLIIEIYNELQSSINTALNSQSSNYLFSNMGRLRRLFKE